MTRPIPETMAVAINMTVEINRAAWQQAYGEQPTANHLRDDVKEYVLGCVQGSAAAAGENGEGGIILARLRP